jgi:hypothetical protein
MIWSPQRCNEDHDDVITHKQDQYYCDHLENQINLDTLKELISWIQVVRWTSTCKGKNVLSHDSKFVKCCSCILHLTSLFSLPVPIQYQPFHCSGALWWSIGNDEYDNTTLYRWLSGWVDSWMDGLKRLINTWNALLTYYVQYLETFYSDFSNQTEDDSNTQYILQWP